MVKIISANNNKKRRRKEGRKSMGGDGEGMAIVLDTDTRVGGKQETRRTVCELAEEMLTYN